MWSIAAIEKKKKLVCEVRVLRLLRIGPGCEVRLRNGEMKMWASYDNTVPHTRQMQPTLVYGTVPPDSYLLRSSCCRRKRVVSPMYMILEAKKNRAATWQEMPLRKLPRQQRSPCKDRPTSLAQGIPQVTPPYVVCYFASLSVHVRRSTVSKKGRIQGDGRRVREKRESREFVEGFRKRRFEHGPGTLENNTNAKNVAFRGYI